MSETKVDDLHAMWRLRAFEEAVRDQRAAGTIAGSVHLGIGQEAIPIGAVSVLGPDDAVFATYRGHNWALACGVPPFELMAELMGRASGINGGRGGSAYFTAPRYRFYGENSIVGAGAPIAVGAALAGRLDGTGRVALTVFGDGAMNQGSVHEAMNFAAAQNLPVVFVCENNHWSEMTPITETTRDPELFKRARAYGFEGVRIDGNDPAVVRGAVASAADSARDGRGPVLIEAMTARLAGHYIGDIEHYRPKQDVENAKLNEPIARLAATVRELGAAEEELDQAEQRARAEIAHAVEQALADDLADPATGEEHVYVA
jgi:pyruvate dehydrogenase E1 component alpha subunit